MMGEGAAAFHVQGEGLSALNPSADAQQGTPLCWRDEGSGPLSGGYWGLLGTGCLRPTEAHVALPCRSMWVHIDL